MADLLDYLDWRGDLDFNASSFNKVDALMLSLISYNIFDGFLDDSFAGRKSMQEILEAFYKAPDFEERKDIGAMINEKTFDVFEKMVNVARFKDLQLTAYKSVINLESTEQFAAITFICGKTNIVVFRGTDDSIVGWKEDFNISWQNPIPSQKHALDYFDKAAASLKGDFILIGHSKGGNLVVNTAAKDPLNMDFLIGWLKVAHYAHDSMHANHREQANHWRQSLRECQNPVIHLNP